MDLMNTLNVYIKNNEIMGIINLIFCSVIIIYFIKGIRDLKGTKALSKELEIYLKVLKMSKKDTEASEDGLSKNYTEYKTLLKDIRFKYIQENIEDYNAVLERRNYEGVNSSEYFNEINIIDRNFNLHAINQKGPTLVGLGVLGTFLGLYISLSGIRLNSGMTEQINVINKIIPGMSMAFVTSLFGMGTSIIYGRFQKSWIGNSVKNISQIEYSLSVLFPTSNNISDMILRIETNVKNLSHVLSNDVGTAVAGAIKGSQSTLFGAFGEKMGKNMNDMSQQISNTITKALNEVFNEKFINDFKGIHQALLDTGETIKENNHTFEMVVKEMPKVINKFNKMNDVSSSIFENTQKSMAEYDKYMKATENFLESMNKMIQLQEKLEGSVKTLTETTLENYKNLDITTKNNFEIFNSTMKSLSEEHGAMIKGLKESVEHTLSRNAELIETTNEIMSKNSENIKNFDKTMKTSIGSITEGMEDRRKDFQAQHEKIKSTQEKLAEGITKALKDYDNTVSNLTEKMLGIVSNVKEMISSEKD